MNVPKLRKGQSTVEYMLIVSVLVVGLLVAAYAFIPGFQDGMDGLTDDSSTLFSAGAQNGTGDKR